MPSPSASPPTAMNRSSRSENFWRFHLVSNASGDYPPVSSRSARRSRRMNWLSRNGSIIPPLLFKNVVENQTGPAVIAAVRALIVQAPVVGKIFDVVFTAGGKLANWRVAAKNLRRAAREDRDVAEFVRQHFRAEGINMHLDAAANRVSKRDGKVVLEFREGDPITADAMLVAARRTPTLRALNLEAAGVDYDEHGVKANAYLQTSQAHIYAAGDITNRLKFTHTADFTARIVVRNILMPLQLLRQKVNWSIVPWCTFTDPEVAHVGLGEKEGKQKNVDYDLFVVPLGEVDRAVVESEDGGFAKILTAKGSDRILGGHHCCATRGRAFARICPCDECENRPCQNCIKHSRVSNFCRAGAQSRR